MRKLLLVTLAIASGCDSDLIRIGPIDWSPCPSCEGLGNGPFNFPPAVWVIGTVVTSDGTPLVDSNARVTVHPDSTLDGLPMASAPVDSIDGTFGFRLKVAEVCERPAFSSVAIRDETSDSIQAQSAPQWLVSSGVPAGCPFPTAADVDGVPRDTVWADDIVISSQ